MITTMGTAGTRPVMGFIGLGRMGRPMAAHLLRAGYILHVFDIRAAAVEPLVRAGASAAASPAELARLADVIVIMVLHKQVDEVLFGPQGLLAEITPGTTVIEGGNSDPARTRQRAAGLAQRGAVMLDMGVSGGPQGAQDAKLAIMVGGDRGAYERVLPILQCFGQEVRYLGSSGAGHLGKVVNHVIVSETLLAISEALTLARACSLDIPELLAAMMAGGARSTLLGYALRHFDDPKETGWEEWWTGLAGPSQLHFALDAARAAGVSLPVTALAANLRDQSYTKPRSDALDLFVRLFWQFSGSETASQWPSP